MRAMYGPWLASPLSERFVHSSAFDGFGVPFETPLNDWLVSQNFTLGCYPLSTPPTFPAMAEFINSIDLSGYTRRGESRPVKLMRGGNGRVLITIQVGKEKPDIDVVVKVQELADAARKLGAK
jgi:hypothetical protein